MPAVKKPHTAEYFRKWRAAKRERRGMPAIDPIPAEVYDRGKILTLMMRTPPSQWKREWLLDVKRPQQEANRV